MGVAYRRCLGPSPRPKSTLQRDSLRTSAPGPVLQAVVELAQPRQKTNHRRSLAAHLVLMVGILDYCTGFTSCGALDKLSNFEPGFNS